MKWSLCVACLCLFILLTSGCSKPDENGNNKDAKKTEDVVKKEGELDANAPDAPTSQTEEPPKQKVKPITLPTAYKWLEDRTKTKKINPKGDPIFAFHEADFDLDGQKEAVVSFGNRPEWGTFPKFFILLPGSNDSTENMRIIESADVDSYSLEVIRLKGSERPYMYLIHHGGNFDLKSLYSFDGSRIHSIFEDVYLPKAELYDGDGDGYIDGYNKAFDTYTTCYEELAVDYVWDGKQFVEQNMAYDAGAYPTDPKRLIHEYLKLLELGSWYPSTDIDRRLAELTDNKKVPTQAALETRGCSALAIDSTIKVIKDEGNRMSLLFNKDTYTGHIKLTFELQKKGKRWIIADIREDVPTPY